MHCTQCGSPVGPTDRFCAGCGSPAGQPTTAGDASPAVPSPPPPAPPSEGHAAAPPRLPVLRRPPTALLIAVVLLVAGSFLPWLSAPGSTLFPTELPVRVLLDAHAGPDAFSMALVTWIAAAVVLLGAVVRPARTLGQLIGGLVVLLPILTFFQWRAFLSDASLDPLAFGFVGLGMAAVVAGGLTALFAPGK